MTKFSRRAFLGMGACAALLPLGCTQTTELEVSRHTIELPRLPDAFAGLTICHLSDLHSHDFDQGNAVLLAHIIAERPNIIVMTGDMVDKRNPDETPFLALCDTLPAIAPTYYVTGNHETDGPHMTLPHKVADKGVHFLDNRHVELRRGSDRMMVAGAGEFYRFGHSGIHAALDGIPPDDFTLLLSHHPEQMEHFANRHVDLVLAGHTHGGQIRFPLIGGVFAPDQGPFPEYVNGLCKLKGTTMYVSRGLGYSGIPFRVNCPPEVTFLTLQPARV